MSLWYFLSDWFAGVPTNGALFKRSMINAAWAIAMIMAMAVFQAPAECAAAVLYGVLVVNGVMFVVYHRQRERSRDCRGTLVGGLFIWSFDVFRQ